MPEMSSAAIRLSASASATARRKLLYWAGINLDIQHRKEAEQQLRDLVQTLESRVSEAHAGTEKPTE
jgi:hypothetical protein